MNLPRRIAYYELFGLERGCDTMEPETIAAGALTHINLAFQLIGDDFKITDTQGDIVARVSRLKKIYPALRIMVAVGMYRQFVPNETNASRRLDIQRPSYRNSLFGHGVFYSEAADLYKFCHSILAEIWPGWNRH